MSASDEVKRLLKEDGAVLKRHRKHDIWELSNGKTFTCAHSPSDHRAGDNSLRDLKSSLGIVDPDRGKPGERRPRPMSRPTQNRVIQDKFAVLGLSKSVEDELREKVAFLKKELQLANESNCRKREQLNKASKIHGECWCRHIRRWILELKSCLSRR